MGKKVTGWKTKGMNRDLSVSAFNPEFSFENVNLRLSSNDGNTTMSWVSEKGTSLMEIYDEETGDTLIMDGTPIGTAVLNDKLVIFTCVNTPAITLGKIYKLWYTDTDKTSLTGKLLYAGLLNFSVDHPLETLVSYEAENIQKVYWVDGVNQPRVINIEADVKGKDSTYFDFVPTLKLEEEVKVKKLLGASGMFAPGVIQYAFTYYRKYGQESSIFYTTPLYYISHNDRGASPEDKVDNAFRITVSNVDTNFDYLRIYSIQRTSLDAVPTVKRIQDISIEGLAKDTEGYLTASYLDTGLSGDTIDPTELLYKEGRVISAGTLDQKDNTLFFGNISQDKKAYSIIHENSGSVEKAMSIQSSTRSFKPTRVSSGSYDYLNQLTSSTTDDSRTVPCAGFKWNDYYRLGVQFQYKTGEWSAPIRLTDRSNTMGNDFKQTNSPSINGDTVTVPTFYGTLAGHTIETLVNSGYKKMRAVAVFPNMQDRTVICQGVVCPTMYTSKQRDNNGLSAQASWFFRSKLNNNYVSASGAVAPTFGDLNYTDSEIRGSIAYNPTNIREVEIQGQFTLDELNRFKMDKGILTLHSPDVEFDTRLSNLDYTGLGTKWVGSAKITDTLSDIDIQTETPAISNKGGGFVHKAFREKGPYGIASGLFWDDYIVDDDNDVLQAYRVQHNACKWMVYVWNKKGSLNNDFNRPQDKGTQTAILKKKVISNLRVAGNTTFNDGKEVPLYNNSLQLFSSDEVSLLKWKAGSYDRIYQGNIDTLLMPDASDGMYFAFDRKRAGESAKDAMLTKEQVTTQFYSKDTVWWKTFNRSDSGGDQFGYRRYNGVTASDVKDGPWEWGGVDLGDVYSVSLNLMKESVRMKYKSTPHLVMELSDASKLWGNDSNLQDASLQVMEITRTPNMETIFGGKSSDALKENVWVPCGEPVSLVDKYGNPKSSVSVHYDYGDTYYQRWDCLKTYPFTHEDVNQVIEIGSFMLETRVNIDGRYDRNRGQVNNLNVSPVNFNLMNPVYSQVDNFFSYRMHDESFYENMEYPNQITWTKTKQAGADVDLWTNITLASVLELDGDKGTVSKIVRFNNQLMAFQDTGISQILYNERTQVTTEEGVPLEIANSGKVDGKRYLSDTVGCSDKWSITTTPTGIYFMDSKGKGIYLFNGQLNNLSGSLGFNSWAKQNIPEGGIEWTPMFPEVSEGSQFISHYDRLNQDILFINRYTALAYSERMNAFTSFYDYQCTPYFINLSDTGLWLRTNGNSSSLWKHNGGDYCSFFGENRSFSMTLIGNPEPQTDKVFTNIEFRASVDGDATKVSQRDSTGGYIISNDKIAPKLPFDYLEVWDEYQHGIAHLTNRNGHTAMLHHSGMDASLKRKFRIWRCDIPRDNYPAPEENESMNIYRIKSHPLDRMRNPWLYLKLQKDAADEDDTLDRTEIHDILMTYFS